MATVRVALNDAMRGLRAVGLGEDPIADELVVGLEAAQNVIAEIHEARGPLINVDVTANYTPSENQRLRIQAGSTVSITLPNSIPIFGTYSPYDYGFTAPSTAIPVGSTAKADGYNYRAPDDGTRIEIVGTTQALYFYRSDINTWQTALGLTLDSELPFSARYTGPFAAMLMERLFNLVSTAQPTPMQLRRIAMGRLAMMTQTGKRRTETIGQYL